MYLVDRVHRVLAVREALRLRRRMDFLRAGKLGDQRGMRVLAVVYDLGALLYVWPQRSQDPNCIRLPPSAGYEDRVAPDVPRRGDAKEIPREAPWLPPVVQDQARFGLLEIGLVDPDVAA